MERAITDAPRLRGYLSRGLGRPVIVARQEEWDQISTGPGSELTFDIKDSSLGRVASDASVLASVARQYSTATAEITIYRDDPQDEPKSVNVDHYDVWLDLSSHRSFESMVTKSSTSMNDNMRQFLSEHVFFVKQEPREDHRLKSLPATLKGRIEGKRP